MKISGYGSIRPGSGTKKSSETSSASASSFADLLALSGAEGTTPPAPPSDVTAAALSNLLSLQEISEEDIRRKKLLLQGNNMLDVLEKLRHQLLMGAIPPHTLQALNRQLLVEKQHINDPAVNALIEEIELRVAVELAKLETAAAAPRQP